MWNFWDKSGLKQDKFGCSILNGSSIDRQLQTSLIIEFRLLVLCLWGNLSTYKFGAWLKSPPRVNEAGGNIFFGVSILVHSSWGVRYFNWTY